MSQKEIGRVRLSKGRVGYFDELTRIHLTISRPEAIVYSSMNTKNLKRSVHAGVLRLVSGSLDLEQQKVVKDLHTTEETKAAVAETEEPVVVVVDLPAEPTIEAEKEEEAKEVEAEAVETASDVEAVATEEAKEEEPAQAEESEVSEEDSAKAKSAQRKRRTTAK